jgi:hypothetical protein
MSRSGGHTGKRIFNPFNLHQNDLKDKGRIKFERFESRIKTKPLWWFIIAILFVIILYWYLKINFS